MIVQELAVYYKNISLIILLSVDAIKT